MGLGFSPQDWHLVCCLIKYGIFIQRAPKWYTFCLPLLLPPGNVSVSSPQMSTQCLSSSLSLLTRFFLTAVILSTFQSSPLTHCKPQPLVPMSALQAKLLCHMSDRLTGMSLYLSPVISMTLPFHVGAYWHLAKTHSSTLPGLSSCCISLFLIASSHH